MIHDAALIQTQRPIEEKGENDVIGTLSTGVSKFYPLEMKRTGVFDFVGKKERVASPVRQFFDAVMTTTTNNDNKQGVVLPMVCSLASALLFLSQYVILGILYFFVAIWSVLDYLVACICKPAYVSAL